MPDEKMLEDANCDRPEKNEPTQSVVENVTYNSKDVFNMDEIVPYATEQDLEDILRFFKIDANYR
jgi:glycerol-3-phosphate cytidylyltransferase